MLYQIHHQNKKDRTKTNMVAQSNIHNREGIKDFVENVKKSHILLNDCDWLIVLEDSPLFVLCKEEK